MGPSRKLGPFLEMLSGAESLREPIASPLGKAPMPGHLQAAPGSRHAQWPMMVSVPVA